MSERPAGRSIPLPPLPEVTQAVLREVEDAPHMGPGDDEGVARGHGEGVGDGDRVDVGREGASTSRSQKGQTDGRDWLWDISAGIRKRPVLTDGTRGRTGTRDSETLRFL